LKTTQSAEDALVIKKILGLIIARDFTYNIGFVIQGLSGSGKSPLIRVIKALVGESNTCSIDPQYLGEHGKNTALVNSAVNIIQEMPRTVVPHSGVAMYKLLTEGQSAPFRKMGENDFTANTACHQVWCGNDIPKMRDDSGAVERRMRFIRFDKVFSDTAEEIKDIDEKMIDQIPFIIHDILKAYLMLDPSEQFPSHSSQDVLRESQRETSNPAQIFLKDFISKEGEPSQIYLVLKDTYAAYQEWCAQSGYKPDDIGEFSNAITLKTGLSSTRKKMSGIRQRVFMGLTRSNTFHI
jgi:putative DNA primase/helicase